MGSKVIRNASKIFRVASHRLIGNSAGASGRGEDIEIVAEGGVFLYWSAGQLHITLDDPVPSPGGEMDFSSADNSNLVVTWGI
jgi:hypothetical protein